MRNHINHKLLQLCLVIVFFGCGKSLFSQEPKGRIERARKSIKRTILKNLNFLPYVEYKPSLTPSSNSEILFKELNVLEKVTDDHLRFESEVNEELKRESGNRIDEIYDMLRQRRRISRKRKRKDPIKDKISDINYIRGLTQRYESWSPKWGEKVDLAKEDLTMDEIDLVQYELRRISKKHRHVIFKQKI
tara:strand:- start:77 stop:646 length:570 start_codon:yes stop_codon:yes gene_type:complete